MGKTQVWYPLLTSWISTKSLTIVKKIMSSMNIEKGSTWSLHWLYRWKPLLYRSCKKARDESLPDSFSFFDYFSIRISEVFMSEYVCSGLRSNAKHFVLKKEHELIYSKLKYSDNNSFLRSNNLIFTISTRCANLKPRSLKCLFLSIWFSALQESVIFSQDAITSCTLSNVKCSHINIFLSPSSWPVFRSSSVLLRSSCNFLPVIHLLSFH